MFHLEAVGILSISETADLAAGLPGAELDVLFRKEEWDC